MKTLIAILIASSLSAYTGFLTGSTTSGTQKICYYSTFKGTMAITIESYKMCPMNIEF